MGIVENILSRTEKVAIVGLGYVGLPLAVAFAKKVNVIGFDIDQQKIESLRNGNDVTGDIRYEELKSSTVEFTSREEALSDASFIIVSVPTPLNEDKMPDLKFVQSASRIVGRQMKKGSIVVYESTVYPGVTEDICIPILEVESGLRCGIDFKVGYSPERINPGDKIHRLENIVKLVSGMDEETLDVVAKVYELVIEAGVYRVESIKVAEAAKVIENAQRDINIAFMNELSMLFHKMDIDTQAVLKAAGTKWNFMKFSPGLVGGHCIGIDPYYLTYKAEGTGYYSKIIKAGRQVNESMGKYIAREVIKILVKEKVEMKDLKIGVLGLAYKENCSDIRNSKVSDIVNEFMDYGIQTHVYDPLVNRNHVYEEYGIHLSETSELSDLNVIVLAVPHSCFMDMSINDYEHLFVNGQKRIFIDVKGSYDRKEFENRGFYYWSL